MFNPLNLITKFIKSSNQKELDRINKVVNQTNFFEENVRKIEDEEFPKETEKLRKKLIIMIYLILIVSMANFQLKKGLR